MSLTYLIYNAQKQKQSNHLTASVGLCCWPMITVAVTGDEEKQVGKYYWFFLQLWPTKLNALSNSELIIK